MARPGVGKHVSDECNGFAIGGKIVFWRGSLPNRFIATLRSAVSRRVASHR
jgi:hypothetical protein